MKNLLVLFILIASLTFGIDKVIKFKAEDRVKVALYGIDCEAKIIMYDNVKEMYKVRIKCPYKQEHDIYVEPNLIRSI